MFKTIQINRNFKKASYLIGMLAFFCMLPSCIDEAILLEETHVFDGKAWDRNKALHFEFDVKDTTQKHLLSCYLKNLNDYQYCNLYLNYSVSDTNKKVIKQEVKDLLLYNPKTGEPLGKEEMFTDAQLGLFPLDTLKFRTLGKHTITLHHHMRDMTSIEEIVSVGVQIKAIVALE